MTISQDGGRNFFFSNVVSGDRKKCEAHRRVTLFKQQPGADRKLGDVRSQRQGTWGTWGTKIQTKDGWRLYAATRKMGDGFVCSADRSPIYTVL